MIIIQIKFHYLLLMIIKFIQITHKINHQEHMHHYVLNQKIDINMQNNLVNLFNVYLNKHRIVYNSLFLSNYRESKDIARKRISFDLSYKIINYILENGLNLESIINKINTLKI